MNKKESRRQWRLSFHFYFYVLRLAQRNQYHRSAFGEVQVSDEESRILPKTDLGMRLFATLRVT